jgi:hypothetical protein
MKYIGYTAGIAPQFEIGDLCFSLAVSQKSYRRLFFAGRKGIGKALREG